ncbi:MAG: DUF721 domain-containing protein [Flavobacteriales bacterium]|mgnify:FL=1|jgi:hypothetical protein|tara:strand:+ start:1424 stop:1720 length:297 start_codon:yes stop_codon:yes gene_type:complete
MSKDNNQQPLKEVIEKFLKMYRLDRKYQQVEAAKAWEKTMGNYIQSKTKSIYLNGSVLSVKIESSVISSEIMHEKSKVIAALNLEIGRPVIEQIQFSS